MARPPHIRPLQLGDLKAVKYYIGDERMGPLAVANNRAYFHPVTLALWIALSTVALKYMNWWPTTDGPLGIYGVMLPLPAFGAIAVPIMFFFDWKHRQIFENALQKALTAKDMHDPLTHYTRSSASGFFVLEYTERPIGLIALDASPDPPPPSDKKPKTKTKPAQTAETAIIRHFYVEERYRPSEVQVDLLDNALLNAFRANSSPLPQRVRVLACDLESYKVKALRAAKFHPVRNWDDESPREWKAGVYEWNNCWLELTREEWEAKERRKHD